ncbi:MAG: SprT-like domain-containing protein [Polyangiaceae bacterium]|jgi:hypothetical protein
MPQSPAQSVDAHQLTAELEAALVRELRAAWHQLNEAQFHGGLAVPTLEIVPTRSTLGRWIAATRTLEISRPLILEEPWGMVVEVLKHEMAHQYVHEVLGETEQTPHGPAFRAACARLGVDVRASGLPHKGAAAEDKVVERIARLLALAESPHQHEAEAAMAAAQRLMLKHNLSASQTSRDYGHAHLGQPTGRVCEHERLVAMILAKHFFVEAIWIPAYRPFDGKRGNVLEICGARANLATAEFVHGFLHATAERLWQDHKRARGLASNRERRAFLAGVMTGFSDKLARQTAKSRSEGLIWIQDADLHDYFRRRHPHVRHVRHAGQRRTSTWAEGRQAGHTIVLHRAVDSPALSRGRLLGAKR